MALAFIEPMHHNKPNVTYFPQMYEMLVSQANQRLLVHKPFMRPLLALLATCAQAPQGLLETHVILLLHQLCVCVTQVGWGCLEESLLTWRISWNLCFISWVYFKLPIVNKAALFQVMAWCFKQIPSHYLNQCWTYSLIPIFITKPQWVNISCYSVVILFSIC